MIITIESHLEADQCSATRVQSQHAGFSARAHVARVLACNLIIVKNPARARWPTGPTDKKICHVKIPKI